jgi:hypothetical protein
LFSPFGSKVQETLARKALWLLYSMSDSARCYEYGRP